MEDEAIQTERRSVCFPSGICSPGFDASSSFCSSVGRHPVFENRGLASCCTFALGYENRKETRLFVSVGVVVEVGVGFGFGDAELEPPIILLCWIVYIVTSESIASFASSGYTFFA